MSELTNTDGTKIVYFENKVISSQTGTGGATGNPDYDKIKDVLKNEIVPNAVEAIIKAYSPAYDFLQGSAIGMGLSFTNDASSRTLAFVRAAGGETLFLWN